jgi:Flp pilus assembly protein TadG
MGVISHNAMMKVLTRFARDRRGVSAVEFAMVLPLMVTLYFAGVETTEAIAAKRKVTLAARSLADVTARSTTISAADLNGLYKAVQSVMFPYSNPAGPVEGKLHIKLSSVSIDAKGNATIDWGVAVNETAHAKGDSVALTGKKNVLDIPSTSLIWAEIRYDYTPTVGYLITGTVGLSDEIFMRPRLSDTVTGP